MIGANARSKYFFVTEKETRSNIENKKISLQLPLTFNQVTRKSLPASFEAVH